MDHAFIFDMDGVVVNSNPYHKIALKEFCHRYGHDLSDEQLEKKIYGRTNKDWLTMLFGDLPAEQIQQYAEEKESLFRDLYKDDIKAVDGVLSFLRELRDSGTPVALATSAPRKNVTFTLEKTGTEEFFPVILDDSFVTRGKPDPEIYLKTARALNLPPEKCIVFEDSLSGVKAARAAGCKVVGITTTHSSEELSETDIVLDNFVNIQPQSLISRLF